MTEFAGGEKHGPRFDSLASEIAATSGAEIPTSVGAISSGNINGGQALAKLSLQIRRVAEHKGLPLNRDRVSD